MFKFFVLGLPRSRTYWLSAFLRCNHEASHFYSNYTSFMLSDHVGDSTTCYPWIKKYIAGFPMVVIERDIADCFKSSKKIFPLAEIEILEFIQTELDSIGPCLRVKYDDINNNLEEIWDYCYKGKKPFDKKRAELLRGIRLENKPLIEETKREMAYG